MSYTQVMNLVYSMLLGNNKCLWKLSASTSQFAHHRLLSAVITLGESPAASYVYHG